MDVVNRMVQGAAESRATLEPVESDDVDRAGEALVESPGPTRTLAKIERSELPQAVTQVSVIASQRFHPHAEEMRDQVRRGLALLYDPVIRGTGIAHNFDSQVSGLEDASATSPLHVSSPRK